MPKLALRVHMEPGLVALLDVEAERQDRSRNWMINDLVRQGLEGTTRNHWSNTPGVEPHPGSLDPSSAAVEREQPFTAEDAPRGLTTRRGGVNPGIDVEGGWVAPVGDEEGGAERSATGPESRARVTPEGSIPSPSAPPHRHRFKTEVPGTRAGVRGDLTADFKCDCGELKRDRVRST